MQFQGSNLVGYRSGPAKNDPFNGKNAEVHFFLALYYMRFAFLSANDRIFKSSEAAFHDPK